MILLCVAVAVTSFSSCDYFGYSTAYGRGYIHSSVVLGEYHVLKFSSLGFILIRNHTSPRSDQILKHNFAEITSTENGYQELTIEDFPDIKVFVHKDHVVVDGTRFELGKSEHETLFFQCDGQIKYFVPTDSSTAALQLIDMIAEVEDLSELKAKPKIGELSALIRSVLSQSVSPGLEVSTPDAVSDEAENNHVDTNEGG